MKNNEKLVFALCLKINGREVQKKYKKKKRRPKNHYQNMGNY